MQVFVQCNIVTTQHTNTAIPLHASYLLQVVVSATKGRGQPQPPVLIVSGLLGQHGELCLQEEEQAGEGAGEPHGVTTLTAVEPRCRSVLAEGLKTTACISPAIPGSWWLWWLELNRSLGLTVMHGTTTHPALSHKDTASHASHPQYNPQCALQS